jgi:hypothetical protein
MKTKNIFILLFIISSLYSCCPGCEEEYDNQNSTIYKEKSFPGFLHINGIDVVPSEVNSTNNAAEDMATLVSFPNGKLGNFGLRMYVPTDNTVSISSEVGDVYILKSDGIHAPAFYDTGSVGGISDAFNEGINRQEFSYIFSYPDNAPDIDETNFTGFSFELHYQYENIATGEIINNKTFQYTVKIQFD